MTDILQLFPRLPVRGADEAVDFYRRAFGAELVERHTDDDGAVVHALLRAGAAVWAVKEADEYDAAQDPVHGLDSAPILALYVSDVDAVAAAMEVGGASVRFPVADHSYGERAGRLVDPFGIQWMVAQRTP